MSRWRSSSWVRTIRPARIYLFTLVPLALGSGPCDPTGLQQFVFEERLAEHWAPIHYQDVDRTGGDSLSGRSDFITAADFDGDWRMNNNWQSIAERRLNDSGTAFEWRYRTVAKAYYSVVTSETHWYIIYGFFHPRDWCQPSPGCDPTDKHENDLEGLLLIVRRPESFGENRFGNAEAMITVSHTNFFSYTTPGSGLTENEESVDGFYSTDEKDGVFRACTFQEARGHGLKAIDDDDSRADCRRSDRLDDDYVEYVPRRGGQDPADFEGWPKLNVPYELVAIEPTLWEQRNNPVAFAPNEDGGIRYQFLGDDGPDNRAYAPWGWDDTGLLGTGADNLTRGVLATDPISAHRSYFANTGAVSREETSNFYRGMRPPGFPDGY